MLASCGVRGFGFGHGRGLRVVFVVHNLSGSGSSGGGGCEKNTDIYRHLPTFGDIYRHDADMELTVATKATVPGKEAGRCDHG